MSKWTRTKTPGVYVRHQNGCRISAGGSRCSCTPTYRAEAWNKATKKVAKSPTTTDMNEAVGWLVDFRRGVVNLTVPETGEARWPTFRDVAGQVLDGMLNGSIATKRTRQAFSLRTWTSYKSTLETHVYPAYGAVPIDQIQTADWQRLIERMNEAGFKTGTIQNTINPVRSIYRWACSPARERPLPVNPTRGLEMPARDEVRRERIAAVAEAQQLLAALPLEDRVSYALAVYAGMRRKEIAHSEWEWFDLDKRTIRIDVTKAGTEGERTIPLVEPLRVVLVEWQLACGRRSGLVCPPRKHSDSGLMSFDMLLKRAYKIWDVAGLERIGLHDCRHTFASYLIAAGVNAKAVTEYMGHSSVEITFDRYGHLFPGNTDEAAALIETWMSRAAAG